MRSLSSSVLVLVCGLTLLATPAGAAEVAPLRVMSFNVRYGTASDGADRWPARRELLFRTIRDFDPDLLGVQEALDFQCDEIAKAVGDGYAFVGVGRDDGRRKGEFTGIYFRTARFEKLAEGHFWLSEKPSEPGSKSWDSSLTRMASWVRLRDLATGGGRGGTPLLFVNTHWDHKGPAARLESAKLIRRKLREFQPAGPVVLVGDFNATEDDAPYAEFIKPADGAAPKLVDAYRALYPERSKDEASFHGFKGGVAGSRIDWILHTPEFRPTEAAIDRAREGERYPSDHYPVTAVLGRSGS